MNLARILAVIRKELLAVLRDKRSRVTLIGPPLMQLFIFSFAATLEVEDAELGVVDRDAGSWSAEVTQRLDGSPTFEGLKSYVSMAEAQRAIDRQEVLGVVHLPQDLSSDVVRGETAQMQILLDGRRSNAAQIVNGYVGQVVAGVSAEAYGHGPASSVRVVDRAWFNPNLDYEWFTVPALIGILALVNSLIVTALSVARERELGTFDQLMVAPLKVSEILIGKAVPALIIAGVQLFVFTLVAIFAFGVPFRGSALLLALSLLAYLLSIIGVGLFVSALSKTQQQAFLGAFAFAIPAILLSGFAAPVGNMPGWLQAVAAANPVRHFLDVAKGLFLKDLPAADVFSSLWPMALIATVTLTAAAYMFRSRME